MKRLNTVKKIVVALAAVFSVWAIYVSVLHFGGAGRMLFVDSNLPHRSFDAFLHEIPASVREDVFIGHESGVRMIAIPFLLSSLLWFSAYVIAELLRKRNKTGEPGNASL